MQKPIWEKYGKINAHFYLYNITPLIETSFYFSYIFGDLDWEVSNWRKCWEKTRGLKFFLVVVKREKGKISLSPPKSDVC